MLRLINICLGIVVFAGAIWLYQLKHEVRASVKQTVALRADIAEIRQDITLLDAEWTYLNRPDRLQQAASNHLQLGAISPETIVRAATLNDTLPVRPQPEPGDLPDDPIGLLLGSDGTEDDPIGTLLEQVE